MSKFEEVKAEFLDEIDENALHHMFLDDDERSKNQKLVDLNLVKEEDDGTFTVISIPRLEYLRRKRLMVN